MWWLVASISVHFPATDLRLVDIPSTGGENLGLTTEETEIVWGSDGGASDMATFFFFASPAASCGAFLFLFVVSAMVHVCLYYNVRGTDGEMKAVTIINNS